MRRFRSNALTSLLLWAASTSFGGADNEPLAERRWFESRTLHFHTYSCGETQEVAKLAARLEQFHEAYSLLAGAQATASPPIIVMAFPSHAAMKPFLPLYEGKPANLAAFFAHGSDENLIVLYLSPEGAESLDRVFHEYTHLLLRHNELFWPLWLKEGMAEIYATFETTGRHGIRVGKPIAHHLEFLSHGHWLPLSRLFAVGHDSPDYNEGERQGIFYAESWLLTHYLMLGDNAAYKARFGQLTRLLRQGQSPEQAFVHAFQTTLPAMESQLHRYFQQGIFQPLELTVPTDLYAPRVMATRDLTPVEVWFRLGDEQLRIGRRESAESHFNHARNVAPASPLPYEGLGLLAAERHQSAEAARYLHDALQRGSASFLAHYVYAREKFQLTARGEDRYAALPKESAAEVRAELHKSLELMPDFGPAHHLLGFLELVQGENLASAEAQLQRAIQLEPENPAYLLSLAQVQLARRDSQSARATLQALRLPYIEAPLRAQAEALLAELGPPSAAGGPKR